MKLNLSPKAGCVHIDSCWHYYIVNHLVIDFHCLNPHHTMYSHNIHMASMIPSQIYLYNHIATSLTKNQQKISQVFKQKNFEEYHTSAEHKIICSITSSSTYVKCLDGCRMTIYSYCVLQGPFSRGNTCCHSLLVHATHEDMMNSQKILCSEEFRGCMVLCSQVNLHTIAMHLSMLQHNLISS